MAESSTEAPETEGKLLGGVCAVSAFGLWAFLPIYFNLIGPQVSSWELLLHRVVWAAVLLLAYTLVMGRGGRLAALLGNPGRFLALGVSALAIAGNWGTFLWAVTHGEILQSSLGYYINPLLSVLLGFCFLRERLTVLQTLAVAIAGAGVAFRVVGFGEVPWLALMMAGFFGLYGLIRKQVNVDGVTGLLMETLILLPVAVIWLSLLWAEGRMAFLHTGVLTDGLLVGAGLVTVVPLVLFAVAARRLRLATIGLTQYIAPTGHLLIGVFLYGEPFGLAEVVTFGCIWLGLALYTTDIWLQPRREAPAGASG